MEAVLVSPPARHPQVVRWSLERYLGDLKARRRSMNDVGQDALDRLVETLGPALDHPATLSPDEVQFGVTSLESATADLRSFINEYSLGVGWDGARIVVMGTEPAEKPEAAEDMAWHAIYSVLVAADSRPEILDRIVDRSSWKAAGKEMWNSRDKRPYHLNANDFIHVERRGGSSTWKVVAQVVAPGSAEGWRALLETRLDAPGLGEYAYQLDRSALPAMTSDKGQPPSAQRVAFLMEVLELLSETASVLLLHGFGGAGRWPDWWRQDQRLIRAFLRLDPAAKVDLDWRFVAGRNSLGTFSHDGRKVVYTRALSGGRRPIPEEYIEAVRVEIQ